MALSADLIITARQLAQLHERRPRQSDLLKLAGDNGGEQEVLLFCLNRFDGKSVLPMDVIHAFRA